MTLSELMDLAEEYLTSRKLAWTPATLRSERHRLYRALQDLEVCGGWRPLAPSSLYMYLKDSRGLKPYSIKTVYVRLAAFESWLMKRKGYTVAGPDFSTFMEEHARLFKYAYQPKALPDGLTFQSAASLVSTLPDLAIRRKAQELLFSGQRYTESFSAKNGQITGKGGKPRPDFTPPDLKGSVYKKGYRTFLRALSTIGLTPHMLRKLAATRFSEAGLKEKDLLTVMGWSSFQTASHYVQSQPIAALQEVVRKAAA